MPKNELHPREPVLVERVQTGVRMEKRLLKVLKAIYGLTLTAADSHNLREDKQ